MEILEQRLDRTKPCLLTRIKKKKKKKGEREDRPSDYSLGISRTLCRGVHLFARPSSSRSLLSPGLPLSLFFLAPPRAPDAQYLGVLLRPPPPVPFTALSATNTAYRSLETNDCEESRGTTPTYRGNGLCVVVHLPCTRHTHIYAAAGRRTTNRSQHPACKR